MWSSDHRLFINRLETDSIVFLFFFLHDSFVLELIRPISVTFFFTVQLVLRICPIKSAEYVRPQKIFATRANFFLHRSSPFLRKSVSCLLNKESMIRSPSHATLTTKNYSTSHAIIDILSTCYDQRWSRGHKARGQGQGHKKNPRPRPRPRTAFPRIDTLEAKDRNARGQGQGPRTQSASALQKKKKKVFTKIFQAISTKKRFPKNFSTAPQNFNFPKNSAVLEPRTGKFSRT